MSSTRTRRPIRMGLAAAALIAACAATGLGVRFTNHLDALEMELMDRVGMLVGDLNQTQKKDKKLYEGALKKLAKDSDSAKKEIGLAKAAGGKLDKKKPDDLIIQMLLDGAAMGLAGDVRTRLDDVQDALDDIPRKAKPSSVQKAIDKGNDKLDDAALQTTFKKRMARIKQGEAQARKGEKLVGKLMNQGGGGGGGGPNCAGKAFNNQESASMKLDGVLIEFDTWEYAAVPQTGLRCFTFRRCNPPVELKFTIPLNPPPTVFPHGFRIETGNAQDVQLVYREDLSGQGGTGSQIGSFTVNAYTFNLNDYTMNAEFDFTLDNNGGMVTEGQFNLTDFLR